MLPSGVRVLTESMPGLRSATVGMWVGVGSRDEADGHHGSTHFLEHLLFKGTGRRSPLDIAEAFDAVGGEANAVTGKEHTCYYARVMAGDAPMAIDVITDMVTSSTIGSDDFESEREVILEELAMAEDDPSDVVHERFAEVVLGDHALGRPIGGTPETIKGVGREDVVSHYRRHYEAPDAGRHRRGRARPRRGGRRGVRRAAPGRLAGRGCLAQARPDRWRTSGGHRVVTWWCGATSSRRRWSSAPRPWPRPTSAGTSCR